MAVWEGHAEVVELLLAAGLDPNRPNWIGRTFLHVAAGKGAVEAAAAMLEAGADLEAVELEHGGTPLSAAARAEGTEMVAFLLEKGADADAPPGSPWATARIRAREGECPGCASCSPEGTRSRFVPAAPVCHS